MTKSRIIDLSVTLASTPPETFLRIEIKYISHEESAKIRSQVSSLPKDFFPDNKHLAHEVLTLDAHSGTHLDAPWHCGPMSEGRPAKTINEIPLEWCYGDGVVLDFSQKKAGDLISAADIKEALDKIEYKLKPYDIVLIRTDASKHFGKPDYDTMHSGMGRESTLWLIGQGVKVMGIDAWGWDRPVKVMVDEWRRGAKDVFFAAHYVGKEKEYCHLENLANLGDIPKPYGFKVAVFPVKIKGASAGWVRAVAIVDE